MNCFAVPRFLTATRDFRAAQIPILLLPLLLIPLATAAQSNSSASARGVGFSAAVVADAPMRSAANQISAAIAKAKIKSVIVFDFSGPGDRVTMLGQKLADEFDSELASSGENFHVENRSEIADAIKEDKVAVNFEIDPSTELAFADWLHAQAFVSGQISVTGNRIDVQLAAHKTQNGKPIQGFGVSWIETSDSEISSQKKLLETVPYAPMLNYPADGKNGYVQPKCFFMPRAEYTEDAMAHKTIGTVELQVVVGEDGRIRDIYVRKALPDGLTHSAVETVKKWKCTAANGPDGKPTAVTVIIEVNFQLFR
jgi:TonB family protein